MPLRIATQFLIYEIVCGLRDPYSFNRNGSNECGTSGDIFYNAGAASLSGFTACYNNLVSAIQSAKTIPSFCGSSSGNAPTIPLSGDTGSAYDSNGVLYAFSFFNGNGASFSKSGNTLNITRTGDISESTVFTATRYLPSASNSSYNIWYMSGSNSITFTNVQYGRLKISKTMEGGGSVEGWQFKITDAEGKVLDGSPFASNKDGIILTGNLLPGQYTVEELLPENSFYQCVSENPQTVTVKQGEIAEVSFVNALRTGKVTVEKIDITGSPLAGATFRLEWSEDGSLWHPVTYSETIVRGGCSNPDVTDGSLTTGTDGLLEWDNLYPGLQYRLTETKAPEGFKLLTEAAFTGTLPTDTLSVELTVVNARTFTMPETGAISGAVLRVLGLAAAISCLCMLSVLSRKRHW